MTAETLWISSQHPSAVCECHISVAGQQLSVKNKIPTNPQPLHPLAFMLCAEPKTVLKTKQDSWRCFQQWHDHWSNGVSAQGHYLKNKQVRILHVMFTTNYAWILANVWPLHVKVKQWNTCAEMLRANDILYEVSRTWTLLLTANTVNGRAVILGYGISPGQILTCSSEKCNV